MSMEMSVNAPVWKDLFSAGSIVDLNVSKWGARIKMTATDLGIEDVNGDVKKALSLGCHRLAPADAFDDITKSIGQANKAMAKYTLPFALIRGARYCPNDRLSALTSELKAARQAFNAAVDSFVARYADIQAAMLPTLDAALKEAAQNLEAAGNALMRLRAEYPDAEEVRNAFAMRWSIYTLASASAEVAVDALSQEADEIKSVVRGMVEDLRMEVSDKVGVIINLARKGGKLHGKSINAGLETIDRIEDLNRIVDDRELAVQLNALRNILQKAEGEKDATSLSSSLEAVKVAIEGDMAKAVAAAEEKLTGVGRRKIG